MILVDLNQVMISNLMMQIGGKNVPIEEDLVRHMVLNSLRLYRRKFGEKFGELVICCDDKNYWRRDIFPYYKHHRKKDREKSGLDWHSIFSVLNGIRDDLKTDFPYKVLQVDRAEADDIIATLCHNFGHLGVTNGHGEPILILSSDKDFVQLQKYANVEQYSPVQKKFVNCSNPARYIHEHILKGDRGDGVPNFLSADDVFVVGKRQRPLATKKIDAWNGMEPEQFCDGEMLRGYKRNQQLVDLDYVPNEIQDKVLEIFNNYKLNGRDKIFNYFIKNKLKNLMDVIQEF
jgi:5'-3' exonuclease